jgi:DNA-binding PadR family transcriptional regulator
MVTVLADEGLLEVTRLEGAGNRRQLRLTRRGAELVERCGRILEDRFRDFVGRSGVSHITYHRLTRRLLNQLDADQRNFVETKESA